MWELREQKDFITFAANRQIHGLWQGSIPSRFISELPKNIINENIEGNLEQMFQSYNQIDFDYHQTILHMDQDFSEQNRTALEVLMFIKILNLRRVF